MRFIRFSPGERKLLLCLIDLLALNLGLMAGLSLRPEYPFSFDLFKKHPLWFALPSLVWLLSSWALDLYEGEVSFSLPRLVKRLFLSAVFTFSFLLLVPYLTPPLPQRRHLVYGAFGIFLLFIFGGRIICWFLLRHPSFCRRLLVVGTGKGAEALFHLLKEASNPSYQLIGFLKETEDPNPPEGRLFPVLGSLKELKEIALKEKVDTLVLAPEGKMAGEMLQDLQDLLELGIRIIPLPHLFEEISGRIPIELIGESWLLSLPLDHPLNRPLHRAIKRGFDIILASLGLIFFLPLLPFLALLIYLDHPGPIFYTQLRVGRNGRLFKLYKLRSMIPEAEKKGPQWAQKNDPRITRIGRFLRRTHLDEFPQLFNIIKGDMSVVGPRPERPEFVEELSKEIPFFRLRHMVKPGMAGWALVKYGYAASKEDTLFKLQYDLYYIKNWSLWLDIVILLKTVLDAVTLRGR